MEGPPEGRVAGDLNGVRMTLVEEILATAKRTLQSGNSESQAITVSDSQDESSDNEVEIVEPF